MSAVILLADRSGVSVKHNKYKLSLRAYVRGVGYFSCPQAASKFMIENFKPLLGDCIDDAYKSNQNMGLLFNTKMGDPRILQPLTPKFERIEWSLEQSGYLSRSLIQNVEGETVCLDPENFALPRVSDIIEAIECDAGIDGINEACLKLMPNLTIRKVRNKDGYILIEFIKCPDKCVICKRVHASNRQYAVYFPEENIAFLKCHDDEAKGKRINLVLPELVRSPE